MTKISSHFDLSEFTTSQTAARRSIDNTPPPDVIERLKHTAQWLEGVRTLLGVPIIISSGYRSPALNKAVGGAKPEMIGFVMPGLRRQPVGIMLVGRKARPARKLPDQFLSGEVRLLCIQ